MTKFGTVTQVVEKGVSKDQPHPSQGGEAPASPKFWDLLDAYTQYEKQPNFAW